VTYYRGPAPILAILIVVTVLAEPARSQDPNGVVVVEQAVASLIENIQIPAEEAGVIREYTVGEGDFVAAGDLVAQLADEVQEMEVTIAEAEFQAARLAASNDADIEYAEKSSEVARKTLERSRQANQRADRAVSRTELERLQLEFERGLLARQQATMEREIALAQMEVRQARLEAARLRLQQREIRAPISGMVVERLAQAGEWVNAGQPIVRVIRMDRLRLKCILPASSFDDSLTGRRVEFETSVPPDGRVMTFTGRVTFVSPEIILQRDQIAVWAEVENPELKLRPNNSGTLRILSD
jgi:RND family efflux transporter MFP subunit